MNFNSFQYILLFLPIVYVVCQMVRRIPVPRAPQICLLVASLGFYGWGRPVQLGYLAGSILVNWQLARWIDGAQGMRRKRYLQLGLVLNVGFLCTFKYLNFFLSSVPYFVRHGVRIPDLGFPLGISFFTVTQVMYLVDCYEQLVPASSLFDHATFVSFFPYVISGPLARAKRILHQFGDLNGPKMPSAEMVSRAVYLFSMGLFKKAVLAESFSQAADFGFSSATNMSALEAWCFVSAYALQIYFDFSGYSDMAIASALLLGIEIPRNFDAPLRSLSAIEFWQRWHISLSQFITTYLFTPIVRSFKRPKLAAFSIATMLAMAIAGLWHGPSWTFVMYGVIHGSALVVNQFWRKKKMPALPDALCWLLTFILIDFAFVFFRSASLSAAIAFLPQMLPLHHPWSTSNLRLMNGDGFMVPVYVLAQIFGIFAAYFGKSSDQLSREFAPTFPKCVATAALILVSLLFLNSNISKPFVYFAF